MGNRLDISDEEWQTIHPILAVHKHVRMASEAACRAFRWQRLLQDGAFCSIGDLARAEKINPSYVSRVLRLAFLSPKVIEKIMEGKQPAHLTLTDLMTPFPADWILQERIFWVQSAQIRRGN